MCVQPVNSMHVFLDATACFSEAKEYRNIFKVKLIFYLNNNVQSTLIFFQWAE